MLLEEKENCLNRCVGILIVHRLCISSLTLADKNAPNEEVWRQIEDMRRSTRASAVPVVPDSEGKSGQYIFMCWLWHAYHLYDGKNHNEFEGELIERFGSLSYIIFQNHSEFEGELIERFSSLSYLIFQNHNEFDGELNELQC